MNGGVGRSGIRRRVLRGLAGYAVSQPVALLIQIAGVPLYLHFWGVDLYGEWLVIAAIPAYLAASDLGVTTATLHAMTVQVAAGDRDAALRTFRTSWRLVSLFSVVACVIVMAGAYSLPVGDWLNLGRLGDDDVVLLLLLGLFSLHVIGSLQTGLLNAGFYAEGEYGQGVALLSLARLAEFVLGAVCVVAGFGPVAVVTAFVVGRAIVAVAMRQRLRRLAPWLSLGLGGFDRTTARELFGPALGFTGFAIGNALNGQGPVLVVGAVFGPAAVVLFSTLRTLTRLVPQLFQGLSNVLRPEIGIAVGSGDLATARRINRLAGRLALWGVVALALGLAVLGDPIVALWTGGRLAVEQPLFMLLLAVIVVNSLWTACAWTLQAVNRVQRQALIWFMTNGAALAGMSIAGAAAGLEGVAVALILAECVMVGYVVNRTLAFLQDNSGAFLMSLLVPPVDIVKQLRGRRAA